VSSMRQKVQSALRNDAGLGGLFHAMQRETDVVMAVVREELGKLHFPIGEGLTQVCNHCRTAGGSSWDFVSWPCPTMQIVEGS
jgi:hypothetical protein